MQEHKIKECRIYRLDKKLGCGSSLDIAHEEDGCVELLLLTDRGPNMSGPKIGDYNSKVFIEPEFNPHIVRCKISKEGIAILGNIELKKNGEKLTGLPMKNQKKTFEISLDSNLEVIHSAKDGIDPEGMAIDDEGNIWIGDEYGPAVIKFDCNGNEILRMIPERGLPKKFSEIYPNRGFEAITTGADKVFIATQSILNIDDATKESGLFIRILEIDKVTFATKEYGYLYDINEYNNRIDAKIGDIDFLDEETLILIEQGRSKYEKKGKYQRNIVYKVSLKGATDISGYSKNGRFPEFFESLSELKDIQFLRKEKIVDLNDVGWEFYKAEGIAVSKDRKRIYLVNDNDFSIDSRFIDKDGKEIKGKITEYELSDGTLIDPEGNMIPIEQEIFDTNENLELWEIIFDDSI